MNQLPTEPTTAKTPFDFEDVKALAGPNDRSGFETNAREAKAETYANYIQDLQWITDLDDEQLVILGKIFHKLMTEREDIYVSKKPPSLDTWELIIDKLTS